MSLSQFLFSLVFAIWGTGFLADLFIGLPTVIYTEGLTDPKQIALTKSLTTFGRHLFVLCILLILIYAYKPLRNLIVPTLNFTALKKVSTYIYIILFYGLHIVNDIFIINNIFPNAVKEQSSALDLEMLKQYKLLLLIGGAILVPIFEELIVRGIILHFLQQRFPFWIAAFGSSFLFAIGHIYSAGVMFSMFIMGLFMAILCKKTKSIIPAILLHIMNNMLAFLG
ncbi:type II CAAX endopeptidase family protein [Bacillus sp. FSL M8-0063]|uniref:CPBP family intramembrane glutamic endopeptidase n=1 Tax=Bacillus TaxID=1386 RepID=UPI0007DAF8E6|nr:MULTISPECIES: type II CAAX endopeptidase family protein [Bacillus]OUB81634.1 CAAX protease family protein [Bacillus thuringiensis serovar sinensis]KAA0787086.1 CPBP family intramembrane metalloprotease [Bacillus sp. BPN334]MBG9829236.1 CAAX protease [Bacillus wiedmannii]MCR6849105.1 CPBP family intramembrane metalloprotease [Bacillus sp. IBL03825]MCU5113443.1 CPBP family intramembrane metalloprotease [Bacillus wiedmannii]